MKKTGWIAIVGKIIGTLFIIAVAVVVSVVIGNAVVPGEEAVAARSKWVSWGTPPEKAVKIAAQAYCKGTAGVVVGAASGNQYQRCTNKWTEFKASQDQSLGPFGVCFQGDRATGHSPSFSTLPAKVVDCGMEYNWEYTTIEEAFVVLEDGTVWKYEFIYGMGTVLEYWFVGALVGLVVGAVVSIFLLWRRKPAK